MRTFIAIELGDSLRRELAAIQEKLKESASDVKWVLPENIHLTLKFLGEVAEAKIDAIKKVLDETAAKVHTFNISLSEIGAFPNPDSPRVIWAGIKEGSSESAGLANGIEEQLAKLGFAKENRTFSAHLTLGRMRSPKGREKLKEIIEALNKFRDAINRVSTDVDHITLFQSQLTPKGPIYTALHKANLKTS